MSKLLRLLDHSSIEVDGIDGRDFPDFVDAYVTYARTLDGQPLTDEQLEDINDECPELAQQAAYELFV